MNPDNFKNFLIRAERKKNSTASQYATAIDKLSEHYSQHKGIRKDIYDITDLEELNSIAELYGLRGNYSEYGDIGHGTNRAAIKALCRYRSVPLNENQSKIPEKESNSKIILIGQFVKDHIPKIFNYCQTQDKDELERLLNQNYTRKTFKLSFPFCKEKALLRDKESKRYYSKDYLVNDKIVRVCSQWTIASKDKVLNYLVAKNLISNEEFLYFQKAVQKKLSAGNIDMNIRKIMDENEDRKKDLLLKNPVHLESNNLDEVFAHFNDKLSEDADSMSKHYKMFYSLERSIRELISNVMSKEYGDNWWNEKVDSRVKESVTRKIKDEQGTLFTKQSERPIDYALFSELGYIMTYNWNLFSQKFNKDQKVLIRILTDLNKLRIPIAHCNSFDKKEKDLFNLTVGYWFEILK